MRELKYEGKHVIFSNEQDYLERVDYVTNGLKITRVKDNTYHFNDGSYVILITLLKDGETHAILHKVNRTIKDKRQTKKYMTLIEQWREG